MFYPVYVHKEPESAYGVIIPDLPGCFSAADELEALPAMVQEAVECHYEGDDDESNPGGKGNSSAHPPTAGEGRGDSGGACGDAGVAGSGPGTTRKKMAGSLFW